MSISENIGKIKKTIKTDTILVVVSKKQSNENILAAYQSGQRNFGENQVQELVKKEKDLPKDIKWHMIGHLQRNKVKYIASFIHLIHSIDSINLLIEVDKRAKQNNRIIDCLLQIHIAEEENKFGFEIHEVSKILEESYMLPNVNIVGLMGMATFSQDQLKIQSEFARLSRLFIKIKNSQIKILSMGMSGDYKLAIKQGSNMIRVGSSIFGKRN
jgi:pyridoxal phosphate enzyme (YggS family)